MKNLLLLFFCIVTSNLFSQVTSVDYLMKYNCETNQYDVHIVILEGSAFSVPHRAQFNSQISLVVPTGETVQITDQYMPIQNNNNYDGTIPIEWWLGTPVKSPAVQPENDFYGITPTLSPPSFYNDLEPGDIIKIFSFIAGVTGQYDQNVRFFKNDGDPKSNAPGMGGGDFSNGFTIGGSTQTYRGNVEESCATDIKEQYPLQVSVYPNPFQNYFKVEFQDDIRSIQIIDIEGKMYYKSTNSPKGILTINAYDYPSGVYFTRIILKNGMVSSRRVLKI